MKRNFFTFGVVVLVSFVIGIALGQTPAPKAAPKAAPAKAAANVAPSPVDSVIESVKTGLSESLIIRTLKRDNQPLDLPAADLVKLKNAGVSENLISVMLDPASAPAAAPAPAGPTAQADKKRVIVDEFDYSAVMTSVQAVFGTP